MFNKKITLLLFMVMLGSLLSACVSGGMIEVGIEPPTPTADPLIQATPTSSDLPTPPASPTATALPDNRKLYTNSAFGLEFLYPADWFGPDEYAVENTLRVAIGSDVVYPYGTDRTEQIYTLPNSYYITLQYTKNDQNQYWKDTLASLRNLQDGESTSTPRSLTIRVRQVTIGDFDGVEYIATLSETAQTEPVYTREIILTDSNANVLTISGTPNNVDLSAGTGWRAAYQAVDEANQALFHEIAASITFKAAAAPTPGGETGLLRGSLCFPSEAIPPMNLFFRNITSGETTELVTAENQSTFEISLPAGTYVAFAYLVSDHNMGGAYTNAAVCGLGETCRDHTLVNVDVRPGQTADGVQICDYYAPEFIPTNPKAVEAADASAAGLIYRWMLGHFLIGSDGQARMLAAMQSMPSFSPDGKQALFAKDDDIWLLSLEDHSVRNLTNTTDRIEREPQWWPANPDVVIFGSASLAQGYDIMSGHLSMMRMDGSGYQVLVPDFIGNTSPSLSPDGKTIAHDNGADLWLYNLETNTNTRVDLALYGLAGVQQLGSQAWSPDGTRLALWVGGGFISGDWGVGLGIINFTSGTAQRLYTYQPVGSGGWLPTPRWSPDGLWLAAEGKGGLWLIKADGTSETTLGNSSEPIWSPDGRVVFMEWTTGALVDSIVYILRPGEQKQQLMLTPGSVPAFWINE